MVARSDLHKRVHEIGATSTLITSTSVVGYLFPDCNLFNVFRGVLLAGCNERTSQS